MRSQQLYLDSIPHPFTWGSKKNKIFQIYNRHATANIFIQFGDAPGVQADAWPVGAGQVYTLDPAAPVDAIWVWTDLEGIPNTCVLG